MSRAGGIVLVFLLSLVAAAGASAQGTLNLYCSSPNTSWCQGMAVGFEKATGVKVAVVQKATGEMLAQVKSEKANPKGDIWWAGAADSYLQAAEEGLLETYASPNLPQLHDWARRISEISKNQVAGVYGGILALGYNTELQDKRKLPVPRCWKELLDPKLKGEVMLGNPGTSGTAYLMLASLVQVFGEDEAFAFMKALNANVASYARSGIGPMTAVKRGEIYIGSTVLHGVINEIAAGFPVKAILPCEGVGYEVGSMAIIKGARNLDSAKKFADWALTVDAQKIGLEVKEYAIPTNRGVPLPPAVPNLADVKVINYDFAKYGSSDVRKRLLERWERDINAAVK
jgi:iron(III) transport system substrate-binding protein